MNYQLHRGVLPIATFIILAVHSPSHSEPHGIVSTSPGNGAIDAGKSAGGSRERWNFVFVEFDGNPSDVTVGDFLIDVTSGTPPMIQSIESGANAVTLHFNQSIPVGAWTTITYLPNGESVSLAHLPGDVNGDGHVGPRDVLALVDALNNVGPAWPLWALDIDRSGALDQNDVASLETILAGEPNGQSWMGMSLPGSSPVPDPPTSTGSQASIELVPAHPAPYLPGSQVAVEVWLHSMVANNVLIRGAQLDTADTNSGLTLNGPDNRPTNGIREFIFDYSTLTNSSLYFDSPEYPLPSTVYFGSSAIPGRILILPAGGSLRLGTIQGVTMPAMLGTYVLDVMNVDMANPNFGARLDFGFGGAGDPITTWRAFTGELTGGTYAFEVAECAVDGDCDDANPCTSNHCVSGLCEYVPDDQLDPDDGLFCNGTEDSCENGVIVYSQPAPNCEDGLPCTNDSCNEQTDSCDHAVTEAFCLIDGLCRPEDEVNPLNECESCSHSQSPVAWSPSPPGTPCGNPNDNDCCDGAGTCDSDVCDIEACAWSLKSDGVPPPQSDRAMVFDSARGVIVLFGRSGETWERSGITWTLRSTSGPSPRFNHAMVYDSTRGVTVLFGGAIYSPHTSYFDDTWEWDGSAWSLRSNSGPSRRSEHAMAFDSGRGVTILFGGVGPGGLKGDTWEWDGTTWVQRSDTGPSPRDSHAMTYDSGRGVTIMFGGNASDETWEWDGNDWYFRTSAGPSSRWEAQLTYDSIRGVVVMFGGGPLHLTTGTWEWNGIWWGLRTLTEPTPRASHTMAFDSVRGVTVVFGGQNNAGLLAETWEFGGNCPLMQACCLNEPECIMAEPSLCTGIGGIPRGEGSICIGDTNGDTVDQACEQDCDNDGIYDGFETDVAQRDCNRNGVCDGIDITNCPSTDPYCVDTNNNGIPDGCDLLHRIFLQEAGSSPLDVPQKGITIYASGGDIITLDTYVEKAPPDQRVTGIQLMIPCTAQGGNGGMISHVNEPFTDNSRTDQLFHGPRYCNEGTNIGLPCATDADCPGSPPGNNCWPGSGAFFLDMGTCPDAEPPPGEGNPRLILSGLGSIGQGVVVTSPRYVATFTYEVSLDAQGTFSIDLPKEQASQSRDQDSLPIAFTTSGATIIVPVGRCCSGGTCLGVMTQYDCNAVGGTFTPDTTCQTDTDGDSTADCADECPNDPTKVAPGLCGCGTPDTDTDVDGVANCNDGCPTDSAKQSPGLCGCGLSDVDTDADGIADCIDACPGGDDTIDTNQDGVPDCAAGAIPTVTQWGLIVMALLLLVAGKIQFGISNCKDA